MCSALLAAGPAMASSVSTPERVSPSDLRVRGVAVGAGGGRTAVLMEGYVRRRLKRDAFSLTARLGTATTLAAPQTLAKAPVMSRLAVGPDGTAVAVWTEDAPSGTTRALKAAIARPDTRFGTPRTLVPPGDPTLGGVAVTAQGRAVVTWRDGRYSGPVQAAIAPPGGWFGRPQRLAEGQVLPVLAAAPDGTVIASWLDTPPAPQPPPAPAPTDRTAEVRAVTLAPGAARFGAVTDLDVLAFWFDGPDTAAGPGGAAVHWRRAGTQQVLASVLPDGVLAPAVAMPPMAYMPGIGLDDQPAIGFPSGGAAVALWQAATTKAPGSSTLTSSVIRTSTLPPGGVFGVTRTLSAPGRLAFGPEAGALTDRTVAAWAEGPTVTSDRLRIAVRYRSGWTVRTPISTPGIDSGSLALAAGRAHVPMIWIQRKDPSHWSGQAYLATYRP